jgi:peptidoglycan L-alanyl-D-glutamate endopeptidase CwlK
MQGVHPQLWELVRLWCAKLDFDVLIASGVRTNREQADLYALGRTKPGKIVTYASGAALTPHGRRFFDGKAYGCAIDAYPAINNAPEFDDMSKLQAMAEAADGLGGIVWGGRFKNLPDYGHWEIATWRLSPAAPDGPYTPGP